MFVRVSLIVAALVSISCPVGAQEKSALPPPSSFLHDFVPSPYWKSSDPLLDRVWSRSVQRLSGLDQNGFRDVLFGESGVIWGGAAPWYASVLRLDVEQSFLRDALMTVHHPSAKPLEGHDALAVYSLEWPGLLAAYWRNTGDRAFVEAFVEAHLKSWMEHYEGLADDNGLLPGKVLLANLPDYLRYDWDNTLAGGPDGVLNAFYFEAVAEAAGLLDELGYDARYWGDKAQALRSTYRDVYLDGESGLFRDGSGAASRSVVVNALALRFGLTDAEETNAALELIRRDAGLCPDAWMPLLIEGCFQAGAWQLGYDLITFLDDTTHHAAHHDLVSGQLFGLGPAEAGWRVVRFAPRLPKRLEHAQVQVDVPLGRVSVRYDGKTGYTVTVPTGTQVLVDALEGERVVVRSAQSHTGGQLTEDQRSILESQGWAERVGEEAGVWIDIDTQMMYVVRDGEVLYQARCASAEKGVGSMMDSLQTPLGWHSVVKKIGDDAPWGQVFRARQATREVWQPGEDTKEDLVLTRILLLTGEEPGRNKGGNVDSFARHIYIHGTNDEARIGTPSSHGCIRLTNDDVIEAYRVLPNGIKVLLTATESAE